MELNNIKVAKLLRDVAAVLSLKKSSSIFQIRAYENAADVIEHSTSEIKDFWEEKRLDEIPGIGKNLKEYLDELFKTGKVKHFNSLTKDLPKVFFDMLDIPGVGPKTALKIVDLDVKNLDDLKKKLESKELIKNGLPEKVASNILSSLLNMSSKSSRMLLPYAFSQSEKILDYLKKSKDIEMVETLGSLRRMVATIGDLDFAASSKNPKEAIEFFTNMPGIKKIINHGEDKATIMLSSGLQIDILICEPESFGALLQHFTGSKQHNIHLRTIAEKRGLSLSEYGVRRVKNLDPRVKKKTKGGIVGFNNTKIIHCETEDELYKLLGMQTPPPEIREDIGEIEEALSHKLPKLVELIDLRGDFHTHSNFPMEPSHGPGVNSIPEVIEKAKSLGYEYIGLSDHCPSFANHSKEDLSKLLDKRTRYIEQQKSSNKSIRVLNGLEVDILLDGTLSLANSILENLDYCIAGIHSGHRMEKSKITQRILKALENPFIHILAHPTGRLLNERNSYDADWEEIFKFCARNNKILEINAYPNRLDLRDDLVREAKKSGVKFIINSDAHEVSQMDNLRFGVSVARRGWANKEDIVNSWEWTKLKQWFKIK